MDILYDLALGMPEEPFLISLEAPHLVHKLPEYDAYVDLLIPIFLKGKLVYKQESIHATREHAIFQVQQFIKTYTDKIYSTGLEKNYYDLKQSLIKEVSVNLS